MALETPSRPPPFMANAILNFHFDFLKPSLIGSGWNDLFSSLHFFPDNSWCPYYNDLINEWSSQVMHISKYFCQQMASVKCSLKVSTKKSLPFTFLTCFATSSWPSLPPSIRLQGDKQMSRPVDSALILILIPYVKFTSKRQEMKMV